MYTMLWFKSDYLRSKNKSAIVQPLRGGTVTKYLYKKHFKDCWHLVVGLYCTVYLHPILSLYCAFNENISNEVFLAVFGWDIQSVIRNGTNKIKICLQNFFVYLSFYSPTFSLSPRTFYSLRCPTVLWKWQCSVLLFLFFLIL